MLTPEARYNFKYRAQLVLDNLRLCNGGDSSHRVGNMRNIATLLIDILDSCETLDDSHLRPILERLEKEQLEFFKKKFEHVFKDNR